MSEPVCPPISLDKAAEVTVAAMETSGSWRYDPDEGWSDPLSIGLAFKNLPSAGFVSFGFPASSEEIDAALTLPTGDGYSGLQPITDEQLAGIGDRAAGFALTRVVYEDHLRGTRSREWKYSQITFVRCGVVVNVIVEFGADHVIMIARELDWWLAKQACC